MTRTRVLVTGIDGYIGAVLGPRLLEKGFDVVGIDCGFYRDGWLYNDARPRPLVLTKDIREISRSDVEGFDAVVHLAELSNDPLGELNERTTYDINHHGSVSLAKACKEAGVARFVYTSSCSVYGAAEGNLECTELSRPNPQTAYAKCKVLVEQDVGSLADSRFSPIFLQCAGLPECAGDARGDAHDRDALSLQEMARGREEGLVVVNEQAPERHAIRLPGVRHRRIAASRNFRRDSA